MQRKAEYVMSTSTKPSPMIRADLATTDMRSEIELAIADVERKIQELEDAKTVDLAILQREITI